MIDKIQERLNKEIEKVIAKDELTHADYYFLENNLQMLKFAQNKQNTDDIFLNIFKILSEPLKNTEREANV